MTKRKKALVFSFYWVQLCSGPARGSLAHPGTNCTSGKWLLALSASHRSAKLQQIPKTSKRGLSSSSSSCSLPRCKDADHFTHKEQAKHSHQGNHCRDGLGLVGWLVVCSGLQVCDSQWHHSFSVCCSASWRTGCKWSIKGVLMLVYHSQQPSAAFRSDLKGQGDRAAGRLDLSHFECVCDDQFHLDLFFTTRLAFCQNSVFCHCRYNWKVLLVIFSRRRLSCLTAISTETFKSN